ncbi:MFS transporter [Sphingobium sp. SCG-1]|uniref:MFS transporter n=1 Tax=Sphingobium sp. SCG-1 TaxID=2072936 RepID=UPI0016713D1C|nr:MFS transporter [Sphingobium sp. SCG-1]
MTPATRPFARNCIMAVLCLVAVANYIDRQIVGILLEPIKREFGVSDTAMGFLTGLRFAGFYAAAAIPLAWLSERKPRSKVLAGCVIVWCLLTGLGGLAQTFWQLAFTRVGVAVSESGGIPASHLITSEMYEPNLQARAIAVLSGAQSIVMGLGFALGGWLSQAFDWRLTFILVGVPGLLLALPLLFMKDIPRGKSDRIAEAIENMSFKETFKTL